MTEHVFEQRLYSLDRENNRKLVATQHLGEYKIALDCKAEEFIGSCILTSTLYNDRWAITTGFNKRSNNCHERLCCNNSFFHRL